MTSVVEYVEDCELKIFRVTHEAQGITLPTQWAAVVERVTGWESAGPGADAVDFEPYLSILIKWDSCSHVTFGESAEARGYLHLCGARYFRQHVMLMGWLYRRAFEAMGRDPEPDEVWPS